MSGAVGAVGGGAGAGAGMVAGGGAGVASVGGMGSGGSSGGSGLASVGKIGKSADGDIGSKAGSVGGNLSGMMNIQNNNNLNLGNMDNKVGAAESGRGASKVGGASQGGLQVNQSSFTSVTVIEQKTEININFGDTEKAMEQVFDLFSGKGEDKTLFDLLLAIFEKQQEMIMELFQVLLEATGMSAMNGQA